MKVVLALIVALQVSVCLCEIPPPDQELKEKYDGLRAIFLKRLANAYANAHTTFETLAKNTITGDAAKEVLQHVNANERFNAYKKLAQGLAEELEPAVEKARNGALGAYGAFLRPYIGVYLDAAINNIKPILDVVLPAEDH